MAIRLSRPRALALCALPVLALFGAAAFAPLPFTVAQPGTTANVLGDSKGEPVITIKGAPTRTTDGQLRMTTILATSPTADVRVASVVDSWFRGDRAVMPRDSVYPTGGSEKEIERHNLQDMEKSQNAAVDAALNYLDRSPGSVDITLHLEDVGGPSAGLFFALGIVDKLVGDGSGGDLTGGRTVSRHGDHRAQRRGRRGRRGLPEDTGRPAGRRDRLPRPEGGVHTGEVRAPRGPAADPRHDTEERGVLAAGA